MLVALSFALLASRHVVAQADIASSVLSGSVKGQQIAASESFTIRILTDGTQALYTLNFPGLTCAYTAYDPRQGPRLTMIYSASQIGWAGIGAGTAMETMDAYIVWPNSTGSWTLSHRTASSEVMPTVPKGDSQATLQSAGVRVVDSNETSVSFIRPLSLSSTSYVTDKSQEQNLAMGQNPIIYAFSAKRPSGDGYSASFSKHSFSDVNEIDLSVDYVLPAAAASASATASSVAIAASSSISSARTSAASSRSFATVATPTAAASSGQSSAQSSAGDDDDDDDDETAASWTTYDAYVTAHATLGAVAWLLLAPFGVLIGRLGRNALSYWFQLHRAVQYLTAILTIVSFALGVKAVQLNDDLHFNDSHKDIGIVVLIMTLIQVALGMLAHFLFNADRKRRPLQNLAHIGLGLSLTVLVWVQIWLGFHEYDKDGARDTPLSVKILTGLVMGLAGVLYIVGIGFALRQRQRGTAQDDQSVEKLSSNTGSEEQMTEAR